MNEMQLAFELSVGSVVSLGDRDGAIVTIFGMEQALVRDLVSGKVDQFKLSELGPPRDFVDRKPRVDDLAVIPDDDWNAAQERLRIIRPLLHPYRTLVEVKERAKEAKVHHTTVYRWIQQFEATGKLSSLLPSKPSGGRGKSRLTSELEEVVQKTIAEFYLTKQRPSITKTWEEVKVRCEAKGLEPPNPNTVRNRITMLSEFLKLKRRVGAREAKEAFFLDSGSFPGADFPLATVQIDHSLLDIILLDSETRRPIGRVWITVAIDVFSRMVVGYYLSLDPPGAISVGMCMTHAILPKEVGLAKLDIVTPWPCWGVPRSLHADNGRDFRGQMLRRACDEYGITQEFRPVKTPNYGGHIERLMGTFGKEIHALPGTTWSSVQERGSYDSAARAVFTFEELNKWLLTFILGVYHQRPHKGLDGQSPLQRWEEGILGSSTRPGVGIPLRVANERRLRMDFLPFKEGTLQHYGLVWDSITYSSDVLRPYVHAKDPTHPKQKRKYLFRRDPRDISVVYFYDQDMQDYFAIPYRDVSHPAISLWELREARRLLREDHRKSIDEAMIFDAIKSMRSIQEQAAHQTRKARRSSARRKVHQGLDLHGKREVKPLQLQPAVHLPRTPGPHFTEAIPLARPRRVIVPFEEIE